MIIEKPERRARGVAIVGLAWQLVLSVFLIILWSYSQSQSILAVERMAAFGELIWVVLLLVHHQRKLVQDEDFESDQLQRDREQSGGGEALFDVAGERLLLARRRLQWMYRLVLPGFTILTMLGLLWSALGAWPWSFSDSFTATNWPEIKNLANGMLVWFLGGAAFLSFLLSRYIVGMARQPEWQMLRAGSSYLMGVTLALVATAAVLAVHVFTGNAVPEHVLAFVLRILMLVLAAEFAMNFVLDFYRPRVPGEAPRPSFDSRLLGLFSEPGGIARSIAEAINYQFGFDVSSTWFYQLLQRSVVPLIGFGVITMILASSLVFVDAGETAIVERFGKRLPPDLKPGLHLTWPWPIDRAYRVAKDRIHELKIGVEEKGADDQKKNELILWTNKHGQEPHLLVLLSTPELSKHLGTRDQDTATQPARMETPAAEPSTEPSAGGGKDKGKDKDIGRAVPVSILRVAATIQYRVRDAWDWLTVYEAPETMLEAIANREILKHCASADVLGLMGAERGSIEKEIRDAIQASANDVKLGVDIVFFGLQGVHPPAELGEDFQKVVSAEHEKIAAVNSAEAEANKTLTQSAGDVDVTQARQLSAAIGEMNRLDTDPSAAAAERTAARERVQALLFGDPQQGFRPIGGQVAVKLAKARATRWTLENEAAAKAVLFEQQMATKNAAPNVFRMREYLAALERSMSKARKYIVVAEGLTQQPIFQLNLQDPLTAPLDTSTEASK